MSLSSEKLKNKVCVVTGSAKSIGFGIAQKFAEQGAKTILIDLDPAVTDSAKRLSDSGLMAWSYVLDITDRAAVLTLFDEIVKTVGPVYALINVAGLVSQHPFLECTEMEFQRDFGVNVYGTAWCCQGAIPSMLTAGQGGKIINFSSKSGKTGSALMVPYSASKGAVIAMTQALAYEYAGENINVNCICPGITDATGVWKNVSADYIENLKLPREEVVRKFTAKIPLGRLTSVEDVVEYVFFLTSEGDYITGQAINITGGRELH
ncbi:MAG: SDR family NAD(P)-dependent oxidoreductase [Lawsonibacter sp.]|nr:SDR family NAD(P)-dependent oxidoreductase [Lawsonibacter sp.]